MPVAGGRRGLEAAEDPVEQRVDQLVLGGEVVVERHGAAPRLVATARMCHRLRTHRRVRSTRRRRGRRRAWSDPRGRRVRRAVPVGGGLPFAFALPPSRLTYIVHRL